jgi:hypothetical protein
MLPEMEIEISAPSKAAKTYPAVELELFWSGRHRFQSHGA